MRLDVEKAGELKEKRGRLWRFLEARKLDGILITKRSNFAWITAGGDNHIFLASEAGAASVLLTKDGNYLLAASMDGDRLMAEEVAGQGYELRQYAWFEGRQKTLEELTKGKRIGSDLPVPGLETVQEDWRELVYPLTAAEVERSRQNGRLIEEAFIEISLMVKPGDSELSIAGKLAGACTCRGISLSVLLVGSDERLYKYRHCLPTPKPVKNLLLMHVAGQRLGLHANITRMLHFGPLPEDLKARHRAVSYIHSHILHGLVAGGYFSSLFERIKKAYAETGFEDEWKGHVQGGPAGYEACYPMLLLEPEARIQVNQTYDWLVTVPGTKTEELSLLTEGGAELLSFGAGWPELTYEIGGKLYRMPDILQN
jgi:Xaa-Pro dipeptidase